MTVPALDEVLDLLHEIAPLELAAEWDNVGLLLHPARESDRVARCLLTIDLTDAVVREAHAFGADLVVSYHPPIFRPLSRLDVADPTQARVLEALRAGFSVYSPHTALDAVPGGLADWLLEGMLAADAPISVHACGEGEFGRFAELGRPLAWRTLLERAKKLFGVKYLQVAKPDGMAAKVRSIAVAAGAGSGALRGVDADVWITGEMSHHDALAAKAAGTAVILAGHSNSERGYLKILKRRLVGEFGDGLEVRLARSDKDPLTVA